MIPLPQDLQSDTEMYTPTYQQPQQTPKSRNYFADSTDSEVEQIDTTTPEETTPTTPPQSQNTAPQQEPQPVIAPRQNSEPQQEPQPVVAPRQNTAPQQELQPQVSPQQEVSSEPAAEQINETSAGVDEKVSESDNLNPIVIAAPTPLSAVTSWVRGGCTFFKTILSSETKLIRQMSETELQHFAVKQINYTAIKRIEKTTGKPVSPNDLSKTAHNQNLFDFQPAQSVPTAQPSPQPTPEPILEPRVAKVPQRGVGADDLTPSQRADLQKRKVRLNALRQVLDSNVESDSFPVIEHETGQFAIVKPAGTAAVGLANLAQNAVSKSPIPVVEPPSDEVPIVRKPQTRDDASFQRNKFMQNNIQQGAAPEIRNNIAARAFADEIQDEQELHNENLKNLKRLEELINKPLSIENDLSLNVESDAAKSIIRQAQIIDEQQPIITQQQGLGKSFAGEKDRAAGAPHSDLQFYTKVDINPLRNLERKIVALDEMGRRPEVDLFPAEQVDPYSENAVSEALDRLRQPTKFELDAKRFGKRGSSIPTPKVNVDDLISFGKEPVRVDMPNVKKAFSSIKTPTLAEMMADLGIGEVEATYVPTKYSAVSHTESSVGTQEKSASSRKIEPLKPSEKSVLDRFEIRKSAGLTSELDSLLSDITSTSNRLNSSIETKTLNAHHDLEEKFKENVLDNIWGSKK
ncbi:MAG: hypothetical protein LBQ41_02730 [Candidatus Ancillula sp.]|jgi:hypothetical protein|nr:hypothetical protein [Candidatus Ancillula sp.]